MAFPQSRWRPRASREENKGSRALAPPVGRATDPMGERGKLSSSQRRRPDGCRAGYCHGFGDAVPMTDGKPWGEIRLPCQTTAEQTFCSAVFYCSIVAKVSRAQRTQEENVGPAGSIWKTGLVPPAELRGGEGEITAEQLGEIGKISVSQLRCNLTDRLARVCQHLLSSVHFFFGDIFHQRIACDLAKNAREVLGAYMDAFCHLIPADLP